MTRGSTANYFVRSSNPMDADCDPNVWREHVEHSQDGEKSECEQWLHAIRGRTSTIDNIPSN
jgi:hypothetical protein